MSRKIIQDEKTGIHGTIIDDPSKCRYLYDEVCVNDSCDCCCDFPDKEYCEKCIHFTKETIE